MPKRLTKLERELALALECAAKLNITRSGLISTGDAILWGNPSPFQDKINELLLRAGRKPVMPEAKEKDSE